MTCDPARDRGSCSDGFCECEQDFEGPACEASVCPGRDNVPCSGRGVCGLGGDRVCQCDVHFAWEGCGHCEEGWAGDDCLTKLCLNNYHDDHGVRHEGECQCTSHWQGDDCGEHRCKNDCSGGGVCTKYGLCECDNTHRGLDCSYKICPNSCNYRGKCVDSICNCDEGYAEYDCG